MGVHGPSRFVAVCKMPSDQFNVMFEPLKLLFSATVGGGTSKLTNWICAPLKSASPFGLCVGTGDVGNTSTFRVPPTEWTFVKTTKFTPFCSGRIGDPLTVLAV